jgi:septum formation protein
MLSFDFPVFLASGSPRRKVLLENIVSSFLVISISADETNNPYLEPERLTKRNSFRKLELAKKKIQSNQFLIIAADTIVAYENQVFGKPCSRQEAVETLLFLGGKTHEVITGVSIEYNNYKRSTYLVFTEKTLVTFSTLTEELITDYIEHYKPFDKAGSYGIQELPASYVKSIVGDYDNIVGLPTYQLHRFLEQIIQ